MIEYVLKGLTAHGVEKDCKGCPYNPIPSGCIDKLLADAAQAIRDGIDAEEEMKDQVHNLTLYLRYVEKTVPTIVESMAAQFSGMPGYGGETDAPDRR